MTKIWGAICIFTEKEDRCIFVNLKNRFWLAAVFLSSNRWRVSSPRTGCGVCTWYSVRSPPHSQVRTHQIQPSTTQRKTTFFPLHHKAGVLPLYMGLWRYSISVNELHWTNLRKNLSSVFIGTQNMPKWPCPTPTPIVPHTMPYVKI